MRTYKWLIEKALLEIYYRDPKTFWITKLGSLEECPSTHEAYAERMGTTSEKLLDEGWIRIGMIESKMWVDFRGNYSDKVRRAVQLVNEKVMLPDRILLDNRKDSWSGFSDDFVREGIRALRKAIWV